QHRGGHRIEWREAAYHTVLQILQHPIYAGAYVFGRTKQRTRIVDGQARKTTVSIRSVQGWSVLLQDHHPAYISWEEFEEHQTMLAENAHMKKRTSRKSARGGRALLTGLVRCGRCARTMRVFYGSKAGHAHRYQCTGDPMAAGLCVGIGGVRIDRAVARQLIEAVAEHAVDAAIRAAERSAEADNDVRRVLGREIEAARYEASLAARRYEAVDPEKRLVARELEGRWNAALEHVAELEERLARMEAHSALQQPIDRESLVALAQDLPQVWNVPGT
ncbi:MAG: serine recombinase, partial [Gammaproteobacteria bacterium]|nr:serine recombinase [Gammaproteobacteria bacterium]